MRTLFVDCDDTLIIWMRTTSQRGDRLWEPNWDVIAAMERWMAAGGTVVVWADKGAAYAATWARKAAPHLVVETDRKDLSRPQAGDATIDDMRLAVGGVCYLPDQCMLIEPVRPVAPGTRLE